MTLRTRTQFAAFALCFWAAPLVQLNAQDLPDPLPMAFLCDGNHRSQVIVDGIQSDWEDDAAPAERVQQLVAGEYRYDWTGPVDASFKIWCRYTEHGLYFAVVGRDNAIVPPESGRDGDEFEVMIDLGTSAEDGERHQVGVRLPLWEMEQGQATPVWAPGTGQEGPVHAARGEVSPRENGYFIEFNIPYIASDSFHMPFAPVRFYAAHRDWDHDANREHLTVISTAPYDREDPSTWGELAFTGPEQRIREIARDRAISDTNPVARVFANVGGTPVADLAFVLGGQLFVAGEGFGEFSWTSMLVAPNDTYTPIALEAHDINADGDDELFYRYRRERRSIDLGGTMIQEFVAVYDLDGATLRELLHQEVANELEDGSRFAMEMSLRDRGDRLLIRFERPEGSTLDRDAWADVDADSGEDYEPALVPWEGRNRIDWDVTADGRWVVLPPE